MKEYWEYAHSDLETAKVLFNAGMWNKVGRESAQCCEKIMKQALFDLNILSKDLEFTHNLRKLAKDLPDFDYGLYKEVCLVGEYYFTTNYPSVNEEDLTKDDAKRALETAESLYNMFIGARGSEG